VTVVWRHERFSGVATRCAAFAYARSCSALWTLLWFVARRALVVLGRHVGDRRLVGGWPWQAVWGRWVL